jgi:hypothetical protein
LIQRLGGNPTSAKRRSVPLDAPREPAGAPFDQGSSIRITTDVQDAQPRSMLAAMISIIKTILDHKGDQVAREALPVTFERAADARRFLDRYLADIYADGRGGYEAKHRSWWACDATASATVHRYTLVDEP